MKSDQTINFLIVSDILQMDMSLVIHQCKDVVSFVATNVSNQFKQVLKKNFYAEAIQMGSRAQINQGKGKTSRTWPQERVVDERRRIVIQGKNYEAHNHKIKWL